MIIPNSLWVVLAIRYMELLLSLAVLKPTAWLKPVSYAPMDSFAPVICAIIVSSAIRIVVLLANLEIQPRDTLCATYDQLQPWRSWHKPLL
jgi:hypothetical protein